MKIKKLYVKNFRNIKEAEFDFSDNINIFIGNNAQGKTNLMEAVSVCIGKGFRNSKPAAFVPFSAPMGTNTYIKLIFTSDIFPDKENVIDYSVIDGKVKVELNHIKMKSALELYGVLKYVVFIPEHLNLIKGNPDLRRDYLDNVALMQTKTHSQKLSKYNRALKQKNNLLQQITPVNSEEYRPQIEIWNETLAQEGINVTYGRLKYFNFLKESAAEFYSKISYTDEKLTLNYTSSIFNRDEIDFNEKDALYSEYLENLNNSYKNELRTHFTTLGVHRDDVNFFLNGKSVKEFGSQGQVRSIALVLKLAEAQIIRERNNETPVVILDDVLSELDMHRRDFVLNNIVNLQVFITCCNISDVEKLSDGKVWEVEEGEFRCISI